MSTIVQGSNLVQGWNSKQLGRVNMKYGAWWWSGQLQEECSEQTDMHTGLTEVLFLLKLGKTTLRIHFSYLHILYLSLPSVVVTKLDLNFLKICTYSIKVLLWTQYLVVYTWMDRDRQCECNYHMIHMHTIRDLVGKEQHVSSVQQRSSEYWN